MKKIVTLILAVALVLTFSGCGNKIDEARASLEKFLDAYVNLDSKTMALYVDDMEKLPEDMVDFEMEDLMKEVPAELKDYSEDFEDLFKVLMENMKEYLSYNVVDGEKSQDGYTFNVEIVSPDGTSVDFEKIMAEHFNEETLTEIMTEMLENGSLTLESTQEEIFDVIMPKVFSFMTEAIEEAVWETETKEVQAVVIKKDGNWIVSAEKSEFQD